VESRELLVTGGAFGLVDLQRPGHVCGSAEQFLVEPVAPPTDGLREGDARGDGVGDGWQRHMVATRGDPRAEPAHGHSAPDAQATVPDPQGRDEATTIGAEVDLPVAEHVVDPAPDDAERHGP